MAKNIVYFDLETQQSADEVGGWDKISKMRMSLGVTYSTARGDYRIYGEKQVNDLLTDLQRADLVVGFNVLRFDYEVLHGYTPFDLTQLPTLDMMVDLANTLQHRLSLDSIATATFGVEKTAEGLQAIRWFKEGRLLEIAEYCCYDVKLTKMVHEHGVNQRQMPMRFDSGDAVHRVGSRRPDERQAEDDQIPQRKNALETAFRHRSIKAG